MARWRAPFVAPLLLIASLGLASPALAQYRPPEPPPVPVPPAEPPLAPAPEADPLSVSRTPVQRMGWSWEPAFVLEGGYEENVGFTFIPGPDDFFGSLRATLVRVRRSPRSLFRFNLSGVGYLYRETTNRNRADAFVSLSTQGPLSRRVDGRLAANYDFAHTDSEGSLIGAGVLLPLDRTQTTGASAGLAWRLGRRTSLSLDASGTYTDFESERFLDTLYLYGGLSLTQRLTLRDDVSLNAAFDRTEDDLSVRQGPVFTVGYGHQFTSSLRLELTGGAGREETLPTGQPATEGRWDFAGSATLQGQIRRSTLSFDYRHGRRPTIGLGVNEVTDTFGVGLTIPVGRWLELIANGSFALRRDSLTDSGPTRQDWDAFVGASSRLARQLRLVLGYRFRTRDDTLGPTRNDRATVALAFEGAR